MTIAEFIAKWRKVALKERSAAQEHFLDLCRVFDHPTPAFADPTGETFCFEKGAAKHGGGDGFADVWKRGFWGFEYKGRHKDLDAAYDQLLRYRSALENPPLLLVCDLDRIVIHTNFTGTVEVTYDIPLESLAEPRSIEIMRAVFHNPEALRPGRTSVSVTQDAARHFGDIAAALRERGIDPAAVAHFLDRIVFCLFAEDTGLLPAMVFTRIVTTSGGDAARTVKLLGQLFDAMATGGDFGTDPIRHFNGNLFEDRTVIDLTSADVKRLAATASLDWSAVDPSIFGTLFERGLDPAKRAQLGAHFTGMADIELVVDAVVISLLRREWDECRQTLDSLLTTGRKTPADPKTPAKPLTPAALAKARGEAGSILHQFLTRLQNVKILDPACGSGNFLYVALLRLKDLEKEVILYGADKGLGAFLPACGPWQLHGIELNPYAHDLAQMTVWIGWLQWIRANGFGFPADPILRPLTDNIRLMDAILGLRASGIGSREADNEKLEDANGEQNLQGSERLADCDGIGCGDLSFGQNVAGCRALRFDLPSPAGGGVDPGEYSGGLRAGAYGRVSSPPVHGAGIVAGTGDASGSGEAPDLCDARNTDQRTDFAGARRHDAQQVDTGAQGKSLTPTPDSRLPIPALFEPEWPAVDFIIGNPPFLGGNRIRQELGGEYVDKLFQLYEGRVPAFADLCCYWFEKARAHIQAGKCKRAGLLATQGIRGGANRDVLKRIKETGDIFWSESDRIWILDGASVHVSMIGFDDGTETNRMLDGRAVAAINPNLTSCADITIAAILLSNQGISFQGPSPKAPFDIDADLAAIMLADKGNPNGCPNSNVVRPVVSAVDIGQSPRGKWTIDFALLPFEEAAQYEKPFEYVRENVYPIRSQNRRVAYAEKWWQYAEARPGMRAALAGKPRYIATPRVSKHRLFVWLNSSVLANDGTIVFAREDDAFFGILHSRIHEIWARAQGTQLREAESGCRYTPTTSFETFPFPSGFLTDDSRSPSPDSRYSAVAEAARDLVDKRDRWLHPEGASAAELKTRTLTKLYNARPAWLANSHAALDAAVAAAYGWPADLPDDAILERLLALNLAQSHPEGHSG